MENHESHDLTIGIDFGTTNTVVAIALPGIAIKTIVFNYQDNLIETFNSALCFWDEASGGAPKIFVEGGAWAIDKFLTDTHPTRFIQSFKTFAASEAFTGTKIFNKPFAFEDLLATLLKSLLRHAEPQLAKSAIKKLVVGRPVRFAGANPQDQLAMQRYQAAFSSLGFDDVAYVYEPVGAAFFAAQKFKKDTTVLVADFGGGTSDFSVVRFELREGKLKARPLSNAGVGIAGDSFDYRIVDHAVSPQLGKGGDYRSMGKLFTIPNSFYANFASWSQLSMMKANGELKNLIQLAKSAVEPRPLGKLIEIIENDMGFALYQAVSKTKIALSSADQAQLSFHHGSLDIQTLITRQHFEKWIGRDLEKISATLDKALAQAELHQSGIDQVFLTGGSSMVPAVYHLFDKRFGKDKLVTGDQFVSIAYGLALIGQSSELSDWAWQDGAK